ncbi:MAG: hypothetical protein EVA28_02135 [Candidatus Actinomarinales bacterium]|nr:MAG: hypothetical protein EVA28_02135 [Candidatus Actinomarinales bacterium]
MRVAIVVAISVIFASGTYAAFAEEPIPELIFEGGTYEIYKGSQILVPIKIQVENHDHRIIPIITTIYENQVIKTTSLIPSHSGTFQTVLLINDNYKTGQYYIQMEYDGIKSTPEPFTISRDHIEKQDQPRTETILNFLNQRQEASMKISADDITVDFSYPYLLDVSGYVGQADDGFAFIEVVGPKSYTNQFPFDDLGHFQGKIIIDRSWPSGSYTITGLLHDVQFAIDQFTVDNRNQEKTIPDKITGTVELDAVTSDDFEVLLIKGKLQVDDMPASIIIRVLKDGSVIDFLTAEPQTDGTVDTSLVLYDYSLRSAWESGLYTVEFGDISKDHESYNIMTDFIITDTGKIISNLIEGAKLFENDSEKFLLSGEILDDSDGAVHILNVFGQIDNYVNLGNDEIQQTIDVSMKLSDVEIKKYSLYAKSDGEYSMPVIIDSSWASGKYDVYVTYNDVSEKTFSFNLGEPIDDVIQTEEEIEVIEDEILPPQKFDLIFDEVYTKELLNFNSVADRNLSGSEKVKVTLEGPDGFKQNLYLNVDSDRQFNVPVLVDESWVDGDYKLSFNYDGGITEFGKFTITNNKVESNVFILSEHLSTVSPDLVYPATDELLLENDKLPFTHGSPTYLKLSGGVANYNSGDIEIQINKGDKILSVFKIKTMPNGKFSDIVKISSILKPGFYEINSIYDDRNFATSEFLIIQQNTIPAQFGSQPIKISRDMFEESGGLVKVKLTGPIDNYEFADSGMIIFTILRPDGSMETFETEIKKWGYFAYEIPVTSKWQDGTYIVSAKLGEKNAGHMYLQIGDYDMEYIKNITHNWIDGEISTFQYTNRLNTALENNAITFHHIESKMIPNWFKNTAKLWIDDTLSKDAFFESLRFLTSS